MKSIVFFFYWAMAGLLLLAACQGNKQSKSTAQKDSPPSGEALPEVSDIPGMQAASSSDNLKSVLPFYQEGTIYQSLQEALLEPEKVFRIRLRGQRLQSLPLDIFRLTNLRELDLSDNELTSLPDSFATKLNRLEILDLSYNRFSQFPDKLSLLENLGYLNLKGNLLRSLPATIQALPNLLVLDLGENRFTEVPPVVCELNQLKWLYLDGIPVDTLPAHFSQLTQLRRLSLRKGRLKEVPPMLAGLSGLEEVILSGNQIQAVGPVFNNLKQLTYLNLRANRLDSTRFLSDLPPLLHLDVSQNPFNTLPDDFFDRHRSLKALDLSHTRLEALPAGLSRCQGLVWLAIQGINLRQFPEEIGACRRLRVLYLGQHPQLLAENILGTLGEMGQLHTLKILQLNNQPLVFSSVLARLEGLVELDLKGNRLADPEALLGQLAQLPNLQALNLANCGVRQAHPSFQNLKSLRLLGLDLKSMPLAEVQKIPILLPPGAEVVDGTEFFSYRMMQEGGENLPE